MSLSTYLNLYLITGKFSYLICNFSVFLFIQIQLN